MPRIFRTDVLLAFLLAMLAGFAGNFPVSFFCALGTGMLTLNRWGEPKLPYARLWFSIGLWLWGSLMGLWLTSLLVEQPFATHLLNFTVGLGGALMGVWALSLSVNRWWARRVPG